MGVQLPMLGDSAFQSQFHRERGFAIRESGSVSEPEKMRVHRDGWLAKRDIQHDIRGFSPHAREGLQGFTVAWNLTVKIGRASCRERV